MYFHYTWQQYQDIYKSNSFHKVRRDFLHILNVAIKILLITVGETINIYHQHRQELRSIEEIITICMYVHQDTEILLKYKLTCIERTVGFIKRAALFFRID